MAHYAWIDETNTVISVTVGVDENLIDGEIGGSTEAWEKFYTEAINQPGVYVKRTSYHGNIRKRFAGIGYTYNELKDEFIPPQPFPSWSWDEIGEWKAPIERPNGYFWQWNEELGDWVNAEAL